MGHLFDSLKMILSNRGAAGSVWQELKDSNSYRTVLETGMLTINTKLLNIKLIPLPFFAVYKAKKGGVNELNTRHSFILRMKEMKEIKMKTTTCLAIGKSTDPTAALNAYGTLDRNNICADKSGNLLSL